jgi:hypothetical protein
MWPFECVHDRACKKDLNYYYTHVCLTESNIRLLHDYWTNLASNTREKVSLKCSLKENAIVSDVGATK